MLVLLTAAGSFIGGHLLRHLLAAGYEVVATHRGPPSSSGGEDDARCRHVQLNLADAQDYARILPHKIDHVVHVAGVSVGGRDSVIGMLDCNVLGTALLAEYATRAGVRKIVHTSSLSVHGRIEADVVDERTPSIEPGVYGASKLAGERILAEAAGALAVLSLRLPGTLGLGAHRAWIPTVTERLRAGAPVQIYNPEARFNNAMHVEDLGRLVVRALQQPWQGYRALPLGAAGMTTVGAAVETLKQALGSRSAVEVVAKSGHGFTISSAAAQAEFGYDPMEISAMLTRYAGECGEWGRDGANGRS